MAFDPIAGSAYATTTDPVILDSQPWLFPEGFTQTEVNVPSDIWVAEPDHDGDGYSDAVHLFASLKDAEAEGTGIYIAKDPRTLLVNVQHSATGNDKTMAISKR